MLHNIKPRSLVVCAVMSTGLLLTLSVMRPPARSQTQGGTYDQAILLNTGRMVAEGRTTFRFDTFGDEAFWGDTLKLHQAIEGAAHGGVGAGISPRQALAL